MSLSYENFTDKQLECIEFYCKNDLKELKKLCNPILKSKSIPYMNYDDLYDVAIECLCHSVKNYNEEKSQFKTFFIGNIKRKFSTWMRDSTRNCRCNVERDENGNIVVDKHTGNNIVIYDTSIHSETDEGYSLEETIASDYDLEDCVIDSLEEHEDKIINYMKTLTKLQKRIVNLLSMGYKKEEIMQELYLKDKEYNDNLNGIRSFERVKILY